MQTVIQVGATRDGLDPYKQVVEDRGMQCLLIETPEYLELRKHLGRTPFQQEIAVAEPSDPQQVVAAIQALSLADAPIAILAGFERYIFAAYNAAATLDVHPYTTNKPFQPPTKIEARDLIKNHAILQPRYLLLKHAAITPEMLDNMRFPLVVKPIDGGGGLGTFKVGTYAALQDALQRLQNIKNYDGADFAGLMVEEAVDGQEFSLQGYVRNGQPTVLTICKKLIFTMPVGDNIWVFREAGHIATTGETLDLALQDWLRTCLAALVYKNGPFMVDGMQTSRGAYFLEMNFRLSGFGILKLVTKVSGRNWAEEAFSVSLGLAPMPLVGADRSVCVGELRARFSSELERGMALVSQKRATVEHIVATAPTFNSKRLESDLTRLGGTLGKITVETQTVEEAEKMLISCLVERKPYLIRSLG